MHNAAYIEADHVVSATFLREFLGDFAPFPRFVY
jgi:hypothetical protein